MLIYVEVPPYLCMHFCTDTLAHTSTCSDSNIFVTWRIRMCNIPHWSAWHDSLIMSHTWMRHITHIYASHHTYIWVMPHVYVDDRPWCTHIPMHTSTYSFTIICSCICVPPNASIYHTHIHAPIYIRLYIDVLIYLCTYGISIFSTTHINAFIYALRYIEVIIHLCTYEYICVQSGVES